MAIPEKQLETWANVGAEVSAQATYASLNTALRSPKSQILNRSFDVYLQGSYKNATNIYGDSDVDVVVESNESFSYDIGNLTDSQQSTFHKTFKAVSYTFEQFRNDVQATLVAYYGSDQVKPRDKCIQVLKQAGRLDGDVIACQGYRRYVADPSVAVPGYHEGISFRTRKENRLVVNYPRLHHTAGTKKNQGVQQRYKPAVRIFKNLRNYLSAESLIEDDTAPSYFVECLIFNAPAECFKATHFHTVLAVLVWLHKLLTEGGLDKLVCGNEVLWLFGESREQWKIDKAKRFINAAIDTWNKWDK